MTDPVSVIRAESYDIVALRRHIEELVSSIGGWDNILDRRERVLLKPNLLAARTPDRAVTTHPNVVEAVASSLIDYGASVAIGDSPAGAHKGVERVFRNTGMIDVAEKLGIEWINFEASGARKIETKSGVTLNINRAIENFDRIISISKLKTHSFMVYTGAVKNLFGLVPGFRKTSYHKLYPKPSRFARMILDIYENIPISLHIMDAIIGMEGNGPSSGDPREVGLLLASTDGIALDRVAEHIVGIKKNYTPIGKLASKDHPRSTDLDSIRILGGKIEDFILDKPFKLTPRIPEIFIPSWLIRPLAGLIWIRPKPQDALCVRCGICAQSCPVDAITMRGSQIPEFNYKKCITCLCCHETCPEKAITLEKSFIARFIH